jgi:hypothetical protein
VVRATATVAEGRPIRSDRTVDLGEGEATKAHNRRVEARASLSRAFCVVNFHLIRTGSIALLLPRRDFGDEDLAFADAAIQALTA